MKRLQKVVEFCIRHQTVLGCTTVSLMTVASEQIFSSVVFKCPCNSNNMLYGASFLLAPAFILFLLGFMVNYRIWPMLTGECSPEKDLQCCSCGTCAHFCKILLPIAAKASVAPLTWIAVALLGANYYECAASGSILMVRIYCKDNGTYHGKQLFELPCDEKLSANFTSECLSLQAQSQLTGWFLIASIMAVALFLTCLHHCRARVSYHQLRFCEIYSKKEHELLEKKAEEHATKLAERNTNYFFGSTDSATFHTPSKKDWEKISNVNTINSEESYYSMLHQYVSTNRGNSNKSNGEGQHRTDSSNRNTDQTTF